LLPLRDLKQKESTRLSADPIDEQERLAVSIGHEAFVEEWVREATSTHFDELSDPLA